MGFDPSLGPRDPAVAQLDPPRVAALLASSATAIVAELDALGDELARWRPGPDEWCANEVVGHIIEADRRGFGGRIERILEHDGIEESGWDQLAVAAARRDVDRSAADVRDEFRAGREPALAIVRGLRPDQLSLAAIHGVVGRVTIGDLLQEWV